MLQFLLACHPKRYIQTFQLTEQEKAMEMDKEQIRRSEAPKICLEGRLTDSENLAYITSSPQLQVLHRHCPGINMVWAAPVWCSLNLVMRSFPLWLKCSKLKHGSQFPSSLHLSNALSVTFQHWLSQFRRLGACMLLVPCSNSPVRYIYR